MLAVLYLFKHFLERMEQDTLLRLILLHHVLFGVAEHHREHPARRGGSGHPLAHQAARPRLPRRSRARGQPRHGLDQEDARRHPSEQGVQLKLQGIQRERDAGPRRRG